MCNIFVYWDQVSLEIWFLKGIWFLIMIRFLWGIRFSRRSGSQLQRSDSGAVQKVGTPGSHFLGFVPALVRLPPPGLWRKWRKRTTEPKSFEQFETKQDDGGIESSTAETIAKRRMRRERERERERGGGEPRGHSIRASSKLRRQRKSVGRFEWAQFLAQSRVGNKAVTAVPNCYSGAWLQWHPLITMSKENNCRFLQHFAF